MTRRVENGERFGHWVVNYESPRQKEMRIINCICDCGKVSDVKLRYLVEGKSNGCLTCAPKRNHGQSKTPTWQSWNAMRTRCELPTYHGYKYYGGRGIKVCKEWGKFENFLKDMGPRPAGTTLDRIKVNGGYNKKNCRWADAKQQANNSRNNHIVAYQGNKFTIAQLAEHLGLNYSTLWGRVNRGSPLDAQLRVLSEPYYKRHAREDACDPAS